MKYKICEIFKNTFLYRTLPVDDSDGFRFSNVADLVVPVLVISGSVPKIICRHL